MGIVSESGAMLLVRSVEKDGTARMIMIDATLSELDYLEERDVNVSKMWILWPTPNANQPVRFVPVEEIMQPYYLDGERRDEVLLRCASGACFSMGMQTIEARDTVFSFWKCEGRLQRCNYPVLIELSALTEVEDVNQA